MHIQYGKKLKSGPGRWGLLLLVFWAAVALAGFFAFFVVLSDGLAGLMLFVQCVAAEFGADGLQFLTLAIQRGL